MEEKSFIKAYYKKHLNTHRVQLAIPCVLASGAFALGILKDEIGSLWSVLIIGIVLIFFTSGHGYLHRKLSKTEADDYKKESENYKEKAELAERISKRASYDNDLLRHLIKVTNKLVNLKRAKLSNTLSPQQRFDFCVNYILTMLCEFYESHSKNVDFRIVFFVPAPIGTYLIPYLWYNHNHIAPKSMGDKSRYPEIFAYNSPRKVCESWRIKRTVIVEDAEKESISTVHHGQEAYFKSMIAYPIINPENNTVTGIISVVANNSNFFTREDLNYHNFIFEHFATRINFEYSEYLKSSNWRRT